VDQVDLRGPFPDLIDPFLHSMTDSWPQRSFPTLNGRFPALNGRFLHSTAVSYTQQLIPALKPVVVAQN